jgi:hypothetical protein
MVRAKFFVKEKHIGVETQTIILYPVTNGSEENKNFFKWTPSGEVKLQCLNPEASNQFEVGKEYYVDFTKVEAA